MKYVYTKNNSQSKPNARIELLLIVVAIFIDLSTDYRFCTIPLPLFSYLVITNCTSTDAAATACLEYFPLRPYVVVVKEK